MREGWDMGKGRREGKEREGGREEYMRGLEGWDEGE